jgi:hypothetical protein
VNILFMLSILPDCRFITFNACGCTALQRSTA